MKHYRTISLLSLAFIILCGSMARADMRVRYGVITVTIQPTSSAFKVGQPVLVHLALTNNSDQDLYVLFEIPVLGVKLVVTDANGNPVNEGPLAPREGMFSPVFIDIPAHSSREYVTSREGVRSNELDLREWGYDLRTPGQYTIQAIPTTGAHSYDSEHKVVGGFATDRGRIASSSVTVTITP